jgi:hypothetical protein
LKEERDYAAWLEMEKYAGMPEEGHQIGQEEGERMAGKRWKVTETQN